MRQGILLWSTFSGVVVGVIAGVLLLGVAMIVITLLPESTRPGPRLVSTALVVLFGVLPAIGALLGYLEGRLKLD